MAVKRPLSTKGKVITGLIYALAILMVVLVIYLTQHPDATEKVVPDVLSNTTTTAEFDKSDLPYNSEGSDKYADIEPAYKFGDIELRAEGDKTVAYYNGQKVDDYTGVCTDGTDWFFVRDGEVDTTGTLRTARSTSLTAASSPATRTRTPWNRAKSSTNHTFREYREL